MNIIKTPTGIIPVDEPAKVLSQAEYDALTDDEKNNGVYFITDGNATNKISLEQLNDFIGNKDISSIAPSITEALIALNNKINALK